MIGTFDKHRVLTLVCRKTGHTMIGKLYGRTMKALNRRATALIRHAAGTNENTNGLIRQYLPKRTPTSRSVTAPGSRRR